MRRLAVEQMGLSAVVREVAEEHVAWRTMPGIQELATRIPTELWEAIRKSKNSA